MNILQLVEESPVLDFSIPLLKKLENEENKIIILCMVPNLESWFDNRYSIFITRTDVKLYDLIDISNSNKIVKKLLRRFTKNNRNNTKSFFSKIFRKLSEVFLDYRVNVNRFIKTNFEDNIDLVFLDQRNDLKKSKVNNQFFSYIDNKNIQSIFLPASPFVPDIPMTRFPFGDKDSNKYPFNKWPNKFEYWISNKQPSIKEELEDRNTYIVGYTGLDSEWLDNCQKVDDDNVYKVLVIIRNFQLQKNSRKFGGPYEYSEIYNFLNIIKKSLENTKESENYKIYIKSHYYTNWNELDSLLKEVGFNSVEVLKTNIYNSLKNCNLSIGLHSSVNFVTTLSRIPTIMFNESIGRKLFESDQELREIYEMHPGFVDDEKKLEDKIIKVTDSNNNLDFINKSIQHLRKFYPDNSLERCLQRISNLD